MAINQNGPQLRNFEQGNDTVEFRFVCVNNLQFAEKSIYFLI